MSPELVGVLGLVILFILLFINVPIGLAMILIGFLGYCYFAGFGAAVPILGISPFTTAKTYTFCVIPLFMLMGEFAVNSGITTNMYYTLNKWLGHLPGGLAMVTIGACAGFAAICGSSIATAVTVGKIAFPEMKRYKYDDKLATGAIAVGGTLGILIPPSMNFIVYGIICEVSIGKLFMAGILPGIMLTILLIVTIYILTKKNPSFGPPGPKSTWSEKFKSTTHAWGILVLFVAVMGGIWTGIFTPTEAAGVGAFLAFIFVLIYKKCTKQSMIDSFKNTIKTTGMIFLLLIGATIFNYFMAVSKLPLALSNFVSGLAMPPMVILAVIILIYLILGCVMDTLSMLMLTLPIIFPVTQILGFDGVWFGVIITLLTEVALITPPIGVNVFIIKGVAPEVPIKTVFVGIFPFFITMMVALVILIIFPEIVLFLPNLMG